MNDFDIIRNNDLINISKEEQVKQTGLKFIRFNRYLYNIYSKNYTLDNFINQENEYRIDIIQNNLNDINYYWVLLRINNFDFLSITPYDNLQVNINYQGIIDSIIRY